MPFLEDSIKFEQPLCFCIQKRFEWAKIIITLARKSQESQREHVHDFLLLAFSHKHILKYFSTTALLDVVLAINPWSLVTHTPLNDNCSTVSLAAKPYQMQNVMTETRRKTSFVISLLSSKLTISIISIYKHYAIDIANSSRMQDAFHMNFVIELAHRGVSGAQW